MKRARDTPAGRGALAPYNARVQGERAPLDAGDRAALWQRWVWGCALAERCDDAVGPFNEAHLLGLVLARDAALLRGPDAFPERSADIAGVPTRLTLAPQCPFNAMPSSVLIRTVETAQSAWAVTMYAETRSAGEWAAAARLLEMAFHRFGVLVTHCSSSQELFDDAQATEVLADGMFGLTHAATRALLDAFVVLQRHLELARRSRAPREARDVAELTREVLQPHAVEACKDEFYRLSMNFDAFPGARLAYKHRFPGMFNCVSQVVYYHQENYERRRHGGAAAIDALPVLHHMFPEVPIVLEEDAPPTAGAFWFLLGGRVYLVPAAGAAPVLHADPFQMFAARHEAEEDEAGSPTLA